MKLGIFTYHFSNNYGALFQAYALRTYLNQAFDVEADFVNYHPDYVEAGGNFNLKQPLSKDNLKIVFLKMVELRDKWFGNSAVKQGFESFKKEHLNVVGDKILSLDGVLANVVNMDALICGSDQVWKPSEHYGVDPTYYLAIPNLDEKVKRIAYAPSFGSAELDVNHQQQIAAYIKNIDSLSVREQSGCDLVKEITGLTADCVPDPTFLLDDFQTVIKEYPLCSSKHVFCYGLRSRDVIGEWAENIASELSCKLYSPHNPHRRWREIGETVYPCPGQWLYLLKNSEFVVTNSFHGTALSILLNKPFIVVRLQGSKTKFNARVDNLLKKLGLTERAVDAFSDAAVKDMILKEIDWNSVNKKVEAQRTLGRDFIRKALSL
ncbi:polysaccharide pyruvyl transferase family protein [Agarivorans sp. TSD2052]|uniref:polysaccharide pyruvyl transferase family protein n=1 Tax=Agarivorans sp. TSD2052 TaxID=2937286 RepID=UPI002010A782|nr:polysaccharide pyruvyl transferase family protein [Agarivorans sp. TSD2052]UPW18269.1 polysaccharide pyruvyl transferase family protein [Agarivorans sp. TSD2052]